MDKSEFMEGIHILQNNYNQSFSKEKLILYYENLKTMEKDDYLKTVKELIKTSKFMPNIAEILGKKNNNYSNYKQRDYSNFDFNSLYANEGG